MQKTLDEKIKEIGKMYFFRLNLSIPTEKVVEIIGDYDITLIEPDDTFDRDKLIDLLTEYMGLSATPTNQTREFRKDIYWYMFYQKARALGFAGKPFQEDWMDDFDERELYLIGNCLDYATSENPAGLPGHALMIIIAKLVRVIR